jgi:O-Antigen ligase
VKLQASVLTDERLIRRRVTLTWGLLFFNALTFYGGVSVLHIPSTIGKGIAQAALPAALVVALSLNPKLVIRPNVFMCLVTLLGLEAILTCLAGQHIGTIYRTLRLDTYIFILWLLTPWWGRRDLLLARTHLRVLGWLLVSVVVGLVVSPGRAREGGRLGGVIWPIPSTQVAHYAAMTAGFVVVLWFCGYMRSRQTLLIVVGTIAMLVLTHTRTALVGMVAGILVAGMSLIVTRTRVRKLFATVGAIVGLAILTLSSELANWLARGQGTNQLLKLTGRTTVWSELVSAPRDRFDEIFGSGLNNSSFNGLPIDSNWLASYNEQGWFGVILCSVMLAFLLITAYLQVRGVRRALALFIVTYCLIASFTEVGFTDVSPYLLELTVAASLLAPVINAKRSD